MANTPKIHHFATTTGGGAAIAARRLFDSQVGKGMDATFFAGDLPYQVEDNSYQLWDPQPSDGVVGKVQHRLRQRKMGKYFKYIPGRAKGMEKFHNSERDRDTNYPVELPDIVHLHWVSGLIDYPSFFSSIPKSIPIVWTLHDMHPFTGGCHYSWECEGYKTNCPSCPQLNGHNGNVLSNINWKVKKEALAGRKIHIAADSEWLANEARNSSLFMDAASIQAIHYGLDMKTMAPLDQYASRSALGVPENAFVIAFGADSVENKRKGMAEMVEALKILGQKGMQFCTLLFGRGEAPEGIDNVTFKEFGHVSDLQKQRAIYSAADAFIIPSLYEAFGQTSLESMACGRPVIGFDTGGIPDMVKPGKTGFLAQPGNVEDLANQIEKMCQLSAEERLAMGQTAREFVLENFNLDLQFNKYKSLYEKALNKK